MIRPAGMAYGSPQVTVDSFDDFLPLSKRLDPKDICRGALRNVVGATWITPVFVSGMGWADCDAQWLDDQGYHDVPNGRINDRWRATTCKRHKA
jgi:hypothetical protein